MTTARTPCVVDYSASTTSPKVTTLVQPVRPERYTVEQVKDPQVLADQLTRLSRLAQDASHDGRASPLRGPIIHAGLIVGAGGALLRIQHNLGRKVFYWPVGFVGAAGPSLATDSSTTVDTLVIQSYVAGKLDLAVA